MILSTFLLLLQIINIKQTKAIINNENVQTSYKQFNNGNYKTLQTGTFYLNHQSPLWVLQDAEAKHSTNVQQSRRKTNFDHIKPIYYRPRLRNQPVYEKTTKNDGKTNTFYNNKSLRQLPQGSATDYSSKRKAYVPAFKAMPTFDSLPGDGSFDVTKPLFIYTGHKGRMLFNTMLSPYKYPMQEPVPGQTLYPPQTYTMPTPKITETYTPYHTFNVTYTPYHTFNVTMIPFYAYEAIDPRAINRYPSSTPRTPNTKFKKLKKYKEYSAFYTPQDVFAEQTYDLRSSAHARHLGANVDSTTPLSLTLEKTYANHRHEKSEATTALPHKRLEVSFNDGEDKFHITYEDDNAATGLEKPTEVSTAQTRLYEDSKGAESHNFKQQTYAADNTNIEDNKIDHDENIARNTLENETTNAENPRPSGDNESTWIILNARYKGPLKSRHKNAHSSKYVESTKLAEDYLDLDFLGTTTGTTIKSTNKKKKKLKPQMRGFVW